MQVARSQDPHLVADIWGRNIVTSVISRNVGGIFVLLTMTIMIQQSTCHGND